MRPVPPLIAAAVLGAASLASLAAFAAPAPLQQTPEAAACLLSAEIATPRAVAATPAATRMDPALAAWYAAPLTDACSGQTFTLAQFAPKAVFIHPMATW
ncbi:MAG: hypothetical protein ACKOWF_18895 [Chloroflexota bacterium]